jgi:hypothetical protein
MYQDTLRARLYALADFARALNEAGDHVLDRSVGDDERPYVLTEQSVEELKVANGALHAIFARELRALADDLDIQYSDNTDIVRAIRDTVGYEIEHDVSITEDSIDIEKLKEEMDKTIEQTSEMEDEQ